MRNKVSTFCIVIACACTCIAKANTIGFGLGGGWGLNMMGFSGKVGAHKSSLGLGQLLSAKSFIDYSFGEEERESLSLVLDIGFIQRTIEANFMKNIDDKAKNSALEKTKNFTLDCIEAILTINWHSFQFEHGTWGPYLGFGVYYMIRGSLADEDVEATSSQYEIVDENLKKINVFGTAGLQSKFLDRILAINLGGTYSFLNQLKSDYAEKSIKNIYGNDVSVGKGQIGILVELKIDLWQIIIG